MNHGPLQKLFDMIEILRGENGCPWDRAQTTENIISDLLGEVYELQWAYENGAPEEILDEMGDVVFVLVFAMHLLQEGNSDLTVERFVQQGYDKIYRRHPHVFGDEVANTREEGLAHWDRMKTEERAARLGRELDESIGGFDETLGEEQREIAAAGRVVDGFDTEGGGGDGSGGTISLGSQTAPTNPDGGMGGSGSGIRTSPIAGMTQQQIEERTPDDVPTSIDDDIIARQLREAALVEEDPGLRERLWEEYRKYKGLLVAD